MALRLNTPDDFADEGIARTKAMGLPNPNIVTYIWWNYIDNPRAGSFGTYMFMSRETFTGDDYYVCFHNTAAPQQFALGMESIDTTGANVITGKWIAQAFRRWKQGGTYENRFWPDLFGSTAVIAKDTTLVLNLFSDSILTFGRSPHNNSEGMNGRLGPIMIFTAGLPLEAIRRQAKSAWLVLPQYSPYHWAHILCRTPYDLSDQSGNGHYFIRSGADFVSMTSVAEAPVSFGKIFAVPFIPAGGPTLVSTTESLGAILSEVTDGPLSIFDQGESLVLGSSDTLGDFLAIIDPPESQAAGLTDALGDMLASLDAAEAQLTLLADALGDLLASFSDTETLQAVLGSEAAEATSPPVDISDIESLAAAILEVLGDIQAQIEPAESAALGAADSADLSVLIDPSEAAALGLQDDSIEARATFDALETLLASVGDAFDAALSVLDAVEALPIAAAETGTAVPDAGPETIDVFAAESLAAALADLADTIAATAEDLHTLAQHEARFRATDSVVSVSRLANRLELRLAGVATETQRAELESLAKAVGDAATHASGGGTPRLAKWESRSIAAIKKRALAVFGDKDWVRDLRGPREE